MAKYGINQEGLTALRQLEKDLKSINKEIEDSGKTLKTTVTGIEDDLGIYGEKILELIGQVNNVQKTGRDSVDQLAEKIKKKASDIEALIAAGLA